MVRKDCLDISCVFLGTYVVESFQESAIYVKISFNEQSLHIYGQIVFFSKNTERKSYEALLTLNHNSFISHSRVTLLQAFRMRSLFRIVFKLDIAV